MRNIRSITLYLSLLTWPLVLMGQPNSRDFVGDSLEQYIRRGMQQWNIPGLQVLIMHQGQVAYMKGFGVTELGAPDSVDVNTLFMIGSNTKAFTGTAMALLEHRKLCSLSDPVRKSIPDFTMRDEWVAAHLNLTDLLTHRMGMLTFQGDFMYWGSDLSRDECIEKFGKLKPVYDFRTTFGYTNLGYAIADKCIGVIDGRSWADFVREEILLPLGMQRSFLHSSEMGTRDNISAAHSIVGGRMVVIPRVHNDNIGASASIWSSVSEMRHWVQMQLNNGALDGKEVIPLEVIARTREPQTILGAYPHRFNKRNFMLYGLGWFLEDYESRLIVSHTGGVDGFVSAVTLVPEKDLGIVILTNTDQNSFYSTLNREIVDAFLGLPYRDYDALGYAAYTRSFEKEKKEVAALRDSVLLFKGSYDPAIPGRYHHEVYGWLDIAPSDERQLSITFEHHPDLSCRLSPVSPLRFLAEYSSPTYGTRVFEFRSDEGKMNFELSVAEFLEYTTYRFFRE